ncbi:MAG: hypothetical protein WD294_09355 [Phycisphaeraceae bacterium]
MRQFLPMIILLAWLSGCEELFQDPEQTLARARQDALIVGIIKIPRGRSTPTAASRGLHDGWRTLNAVIGDLIDRRPQSARLKGVDPVPAKVKDRLQQLPWVRNLDLRMRENGHVLFGEIFIVPVDEREPIARTREAIRIGQEVHWRVNTLTVELVDRLDTAGDAPGDG